jgi:hypothetical protein
MEYLIGAKEHRAIEWKQISPLWEAAVLGLKQNTCVKYGRDVAWYIS